MSPYQLLCFSMVCNVPPGSRLLQVGSLPCPDIHVPGQPALPTGFYGQATDANGLFAQDLLLLQ